MSDTPPMGDNNPPESTPLERAEELVIIGNRWIVERDTITDDDMARRARDFVTQLRDVSKRLMDAKKAELAPHEKTVADIKAKYATPTTKVALALDAMRLKLTDWATVLQARSTAEQKRKAEEATAAQHEAEQAQLRVEDEMRRAGGNAIEAQMAAQQANKQAEEAARNAAKAPAPIRIQGDISGRAMGLRTTWHAEITDEALALKAYAKHPDVRAAALEASLKLANASAKIVKAETGAPPGFRFFPKQIAA